jgi:thymidylate synthase
MRVLEVDRVDFGAAWLHLLGYLIERGSYTAPRGMGVREIINVTLHVRHGLNNVLVNDIRNPSYRFMVAEWLWIWFGRDDVASIAQYNSHIAKFSDDGVTFSGAYGPKVRGQWLRAQNALDIDPDTRQAVIQIYQPPTGVTKDVPCTLTVQFILRQGQLHTIVNMRSSDIWLGLPYDFFNFSMLGNTMAAIRGVELGSVTFHIGSSHLYDTNLEKATMIAIKENVSTLGSPAFRNTPATWLDAVMVDRNEHANLLHARLTAPWTQYGQVLMSNDNATAFKWMQGAYAAGQII